ncbi:MAG: hypothetical protein LBJ00_04520 [Planctomycetaceae bacterium]|nr:hypothetical protein [Planctomycetaceae bacterium]
MKGKKFYKIPKYTQVVLKFLKLNTQAQQREAVTQGRSLPPYRLRYKTHHIQQKPPSHRNRQFYRNKSVWQYNEF